MPRRIDDWRRHRINIEISAAAAARLAAHRSSQMHAPLNNHTRLHTHPNTPLLPLSLPLTLNHHPASPSHLDPLCRHVPLLCRRYSDQPLCNPRTQAARYGLLVRDRVKEGSYFDMGRNLSQCGRVRLVLGQHNSRREEPRLLQLGHSRRVRSEQPLIVGRHLCTAFGSKRARAESRSNVHQPGPLSVHCAGRTAEAGILKALQMEKTLRVEAGLKRSKRGAQRQREAQEGEE